VRAGAVKRWIGKDHHQIEVVNAGGHSVPPAKSAPRVKEEESRVNASMTLGGGLNAPSTEWRSR